jgi:hypothetical protein
LKSGHPDQSQTRSRAAEKDSSGHASGRDNRGLRDAALQQGLRAAYRTVIEEPLPDRLLALLKQLDGDGPIQ